MVSSSSSSSPTMATPTPTPSSSSLTSRVLSNILMVAALFVATTPTSTQAVPIQLHGLNYNNRKGPDWDADKCKSRTDIYNDLTLLSRMTNRIRLLSLKDCGQAELVLDVATELGMQLWLGMWVAPEEFVFEEEKGELIGLLERGLIQQNTVLGISVGSEALYREDATVDQMIGYMNEVYTLVRDAGLDIPVTIGDIAPEYAKSPKLRSAVNVTMTNTFPFWEAIPIDGAAAELQADLEWLISQPESESKPFVLGETGWPSAGFLEGVGVAGPQQQRQYFEEAFCQIDVVNQWSYYWFTGIDNAWRQEQDPNNSIEGNWGFFYANLTLKSHFVDLEFTCPSNGVTYSFAEVDWTVSPTSNSSSTTSNSSSTMDPSSLSSPPSTMQVTSPTATPTMIETQVTSPTAKPTIETQVTSPTAKPTIEIVSRPSSQPSADGTPTVAQSNNANTVDASSATRAARLLMLSRAVTACCTVVTVLLFCAV